jgi:hypothetical protein
VPKVRNEEREDAYRMNEPILPGPPVRALLRKSCPARVELLTNITRCPGRAFTLRGYVGIAASGRMIV